jgi:hypothetical protein
MDATCWQQTALERTIHARSSERASSASNLIVVNPEAYYNPAMIRRGSRLVVLTWALTVSSLNCSSSSKQAPDASASGDVPVADARSQQVADVPTTGAEAGGDAAPAGGPEVPALCPGFDPAGRYGTIVAGTTPFPDGVELLVPADFPQFMVASDSELYWTNRHSIHRMTLGDRVDKTILDRSTTTNTIGRLALNATNLYFTEIGFDNPYGVARMALDGSGAPVTLGGTGASNSPSFPIVAGDYVYYYDANPREIDRVPIAGGNTTTLVRNVSPRTFFLAEGRLYFNQVVLPAQDQEVLLSISVDAQANSPVDGGADAGTGDLVTLATTTSQFVAPCFDRGNLYYGLGDKVMSMPAQGGSAAVLATLTGGSSMATMGTAGGHLYWAPYPTYPQSCSSITRAAMDGSGQTTIVHAIQTPTRFALNATHLFILTAGNQILRVPR